MKESLMSNYTLLDHSDNENEVDLKFEVRCEHSTPAIDTQASSQHP